MSSKTCETRNLNLKFHLTEIFAHIHRNTGPHSEIIIITKTCYKLTSTRELYAQILTNYETTLFAPHDKMQTRNTV